jgi:hypothetical protein
MAESRLGIESDLQQIKFALGCILFVLLGLVLWFAAQ